MSTINYMCDLATQRHTETWTGTDYADAETDIAYGYNLLGELASVTVLKENGATPAAVAASTQYNATGGTSTTTLPNTVYSYDAGGRLTSSLDSATGITTSYAYKPNTNYIQSVTSATSASSVVSSDSYTYRADGLRSGATEYSLNANGTSDTITLAWNYDALDRLISETSSDTAGTAALNYTDNYAYDLNSNRVKETIENGSGTVTDTITSTYNANDELTQTVDANNGTTTYGYDANGSQTIVTSPTGTTTNIYDLQGRLASVTNKNTSGVVTSSATYIYGDQGNPDPSLSPAEIGTGLLEETTVTGTNAPVTTYFLVDTQTATGYSQVIKQSATPGTPTATHIWGEILISQNDAPGTTNAGTYYLIADAHGSTQLLLNSTGGAVQAYNYDSSGNALGFTPASSITPYLYDQQFFDTISGQYYMRARNYDPTTGTFTQSDTYTINPGDLANANLYLFAGADPVNMFDPSGRDLMETLGSIAINSILGGIGGGAVIGTYFHFTGGSFSGGFGAGLVFGGSLPFAIETGHVLESLTAGLIQGGVSAAVDAVITDNQGGTYGFAQASRDFLTGFSYGFASSTWSQLFSPEEEWQLAGSAAISAFSSLLKSYAQHVATTGNVGDFSKKEIVDAFANALSAGATSALIQAGLQGAVSDVPQALEPAVRVFAVVVGGGEGDVIGTVFHDLISLLS